MPMKKCKPEQIVALLRRVDMGLADGKADPQACKEAETTAQTYFRWRKEFGGLKFEQAGRLKDLERRMLTDRFATDVHRSLFAGVGRSLLAIPALTSE
jgi:putative transposase